MAEYAATFDSRWEDIYKSGQQLNCYPYSDVVSFIHKYHDRTRLKSKTKVLEIGCGAGNNLWFAARAGFDVTGIDASSSAIEFARNRFSQENLHGDFTVGNFCQLPYPSGSFDIVIDRCAMTNVGRADAIRTIAEVNRVLCEGGLFFSHVLGADGRTDRVVSEDDLAEYQDDQKGFSVKVRLYDESKIRELWGPSWRLHDLTEITRQSILDAHRLVFWQVIAKKIALAATG